MCFRVEFLLLNIPTFLIWFYVFYLHFNSDVNKDLGLMAKAKAKDLGAKAKDSRYQGQIFHQSSPYIIFSSLALCECFYVRVLHFVIYE